MNQKKKSAVPVIVLTGGGTAGHITPLLAVAKELLRITDGAVDLHCIGQDIDANMNLITSSGLPITVHYIRAGKFRRYYNESVVRKLFDIKTNALNGRDAYRVVQGYFQAKRILRRIQPSIIFVKGGFVGVPVAKAAQRLHIPYITHDSDAVPGLANRIIASRAVKNAVSSPGVDLYGPHKTVVTGVPISEKFSAIRSEKPEAIRKRLSIPTDARVIFVYAGTQGSRIIDEALNAVIPDVLINFSNAYIVHVFGRLNESALNRQYSSCDQSRVRKLLFIDNAEEYMAASDIIIGRAGATSIAEFSTVGRCCLIIPAEQLTGGHQLENARVLENHNAAVILREKGLADTLPHVLNELLESEKMRRQYAEKISTLSLGNASELLADLLLVEGIKKIS